MQRIDDEHFKSRKHLYRTLTCTPGFAMTEYGISQVKRELPSMLAAGRRGISYSKTLPAIFPPPTPLWAVRRRAKLPPPLPAAIRFSPRAAAISWLDSHSSATPSRESTMTQAIIRISASLAAHSSSLAIGDIRHGRRMRSYYGIATDISRDISRRHGAGARTVKRRRAAR